MIKQQPPPSPSSARQTSTLSLLTALLLLLPLLSSSFVFPVQQQQPTQARRPSTCQPPAASSSPNNQQQQQQPPSTPADRDRRTWLQSQLSSLALLGLTTTATTTLLTTITTPQPALAEIVGDLIYPNITEPAFTSTCFFEFETDKKKLGRVEVSLYGEVCPKTVANFVALCRGDGASGVGYKGSNVYRVINDFSIQMGDIDSKRRGATGKSSLEGGAPFPKENVRVLHSLEGMVSMVNDKTGQVDSRFFVNLGKDGGWGDGRYVTFGRVTKGLEVLKEMEKVEVQPPRNFPVKPILITDAGVL